MPTDWFKENAPPPSTGGGEDWFKQNAPGDDWFKQQGAPVESPNKSKVLENIARYQKMVDDQKASPASRWSVDWAALKGLGSVIASPVTAAWHYGEKLGDEMGDYYEAMGARDYKSAAQAAQKMIPGVDMGTDIVNASKDQFKQAKQAYTDKKQMPNYSDRLSSAAGHVLAGGVPMFGPAAADSGEKLGEGIGSGDINKAVEGAGEAAGLLLPFSKVGKDVGVLASDVDFRELGRHARDTAADALADRFSAKNHDESATKIAQALRGSHGRYDGMEHMDRSLPLIHEAAEGRPIETAKDLIGTPGSDDNGLIGKAREKEFKRFDEMANEVTRRGSIIKGDAIADAIEKHAIGTDMKIENDPKIDSIKNVAGSYRGRELTLPELRDIVDKGNKQLDSYYADKPTGRVNALANPDTAQLAAKINAARELQYELFDRYGYGDAARDAMANAGALKELRAAFEKRKPVDERAAPDSLGEQWAKRHGLLRIGKGVLDLPGYMFGENGGSAKAAGAVKDIALGAGEIFLGKKIRQLQGTDGLVNRAFRNYDTAPTRVEPKLSWKDPKDPNGVNIINRSPRAFGLLESGPVRMPAIENSGPVPSTEPPGYWNGMDFRPRSSDAFRSAYEPAMDKTRIEQSAPFDSGGFHPPDFSESASTPDFQAGSKVTFARNGQRYSGNVEGVDGDTLHVRVGNALRAVNASEVLGAVPARNTPVFDRSIKTSNQGIAQRTPFESDGLKQPNSPEPTEFVHPPARPPFVEYPVGGKVKFARNGQTYEGTIQSVSDDSLQVKTGTANRVIQKSEVIKPEPASKGIARAKKKK